MADNLAFCRSFNNRAGTGQDAIFFVFFALLVGALLAAEWRWRWRFPRVRRFLEALPKFPHTIAVMLMGGLCYGEQPSTASNVAPNH